MEKSLFTVTIGDVKKEYPAGTTYLQIAEEFADTEKEAIVLAMVNGRLRELPKEICGDCTIKFITTGSTIGKNAYRRSVVFLMIKAIYDVGGHDNIRKVRVHYSIGKGYYCTVDAKELCLDEAFLTRVKERMLALAEKKIPIKKRSIHTDEAIELFHKHEMFDKERLFKYRRVSKVNIYSLNEFEDYYYGYMVPDTGYLKYFDLRLYDEGLVVQFPRKSSPKVVPPFEPQHKLFHVLKESTKWGDMLGVDTVGALNDVIARGDINQLILVQEALQERKLAEMATQISSQPDKKFVLIAGPSSSGKTTFSHRLSIQLRAHGLKPHPIAVDNYFKEREQTPRDEFGNYDFESLGAVDVEQFNKDLNELLAGKEVEMPSFNFKSGKREYNGNMLKLGAEDILVIEGIHCLNQALTYELPDENKFKIYISALTQLNVDEHNRIPTTDGRLIRRIVRDARTRGTSARDTLSMWYSVRRGEEKNIFPYQEEADVMFNSALIYELAVLKQYAEPLLFGIDRGDAQYMEAKRLLKFFDYFIGVDSTNIPKNSLLREFIGGSSFKV